MPIILVLGLAAVVLIFYVVSVYNFFVSSKARIKASVQEIGNQLKRQADLIPNLESSAKGYLKHEKGIFKELARRLFTGSHHPSQASRGRPPARARGARAALPIPAG